MTNALPSDAAGSPALGTRPRGSREDPIVRHSGRVLLVDARDRLLLWRVTELHRPFWLTPGGGLEPGEDSATAALRELEEETGLRGVPLGPHVWRRRYLRLDGALWRESREDYYFVRVPSHEVTTTGHTDLERTIMRAHRWWSLPETEAARDEVFIPNALASLLAPLIAGDLPPASIEVGARLTAAARHPPRPKRPPQLPASDGSTPGSRPSRTALNRPKYTPDPSSRNGHSPAGIPECVSTSRVPSPSG